MKIQITKEQIAYYRENGFLLMAAEFSVKNNIRVVHETHRGRLGFSPYNAKELFNLRPEMKVTADLSH